MQFKRSEPIYTAYILFHGESDSRGVLLLKIQVSHKNNIQQKDSYYRRKHGNNVNGLLVL